MSKMPWPPIRADFVDPDMPGRVSKDWLDWFQAIADRTSRTPDRITRVRRTAMAAAIPQTNLPTGALPAGLLRISTYLRVTQPAGTSSSVQVTIFWTDGGVALTSAGAVLTSNTVTTYETRSILVRSDANLPPSYQVAYTSVGTPAMQYALDIVVEGVS